MRVEADNNDREPSLQSSSIVLSILNVVKHCLHVWIRDRSAASYGRPQPAEQLSFSPHLPPAGGEGVPVLRRISAKEEALVIQLQLSQVFRQLPDRTPGPVTFR